MLVRVIKDNSIVEVEKGVYLYIDSFGNFYNYWEIEIL